MILHLTTQKGFVYNLVKVRWEAVAYLDAFPEGTTRKGCIIHFIGSTPPLCVCESETELLLMLSLEEDL